MPTPSAVKDFGLAYTVPLEPSLTSAPPATEMVPGAIESTRFAAHVGTPSVAEAAALLAAGPGSRLMISKRRSAHATCAVAGTEDAWPVA